MKLNSSVWEQARSITMAFEGNGYTNITGNFDGQGLSLGWLQWNFGQKSLQPLFIRLFNEYPALASSILPEGGNSLKAAIESKTEMEWAVRIQVNNVVVDPWKTALVNLCKTPEFQRIQDDAAVWFKNKAVELCETFELMTDRAYCLFFDIAVQNGGLKYYKLPETEYIDKLKSIATVTAKRSNPRWHDDVLSRKMCIAQGHGTVHGQYYEFDFNDANAFEMEGKTMNYYEILKELADNGKLDSFEKWTRAIETIKGISGNLGDLEILKYTGILIEKVYKMAKSE